MKMDMKKIMIELIPIGVAFFIANNVIMPMITFDLPFPRIVGSLIMTVAFKLLLIVRKLDQKKLRTGEEYGSAKFSNANDIAPFKDPNPDNNVILTKTESMTLNPRLENPEHNRNKNVLVVGGSGSGKTRFYVKPNLMQCESKKFPVSFIVTDPKGTVMIECGDMLVKKGYKIKVLNTIDMDKSSKFNPFKYIQGRNDLETQANIEVFVATLMASTKKEGTSGGEQFWQDAESLLYSAIVTNIHYTMDVSEHKMETLLDMIGSMQAMEDEEGFKCDMTIEFENLTDYIQMVEEGLELDSENLIKLLESMNYTFEELEEIRKIPKAEREKSLIDEKTVFNEKLFNEFLLSKKSKMSDEDYNEATHYFINGELEKLRNFLIVNKLKYDRTVYLAYERAKFHENTYFDPKNFDGIKYAIDCFCGYSQAAGKTAKSILISCAARLKVFRNSAVKEIMSDDEMEIEKLGGYFKEKNKTVPKMVQKIDPKTNKPMIKIVEVADNTAKREKYLPGPLGNIQRIIDKNSKSKQKTKKVKQPVMVEAKDKDEKTIMETVAEKVIVREKHAYFIIISDTDSTFNFLATFFYTMLFITLVKKADTEFDGRLPVHVRLILDEFANIGVIPEFEKKIATIRSREISASVILQSQAQLKALYKDHMNTIIGNMDTYLYLGGGEKETLKDIVDLMGKETIDMYNTSKTYGNSESHGQNYQKTGKELMTIDELATMPRSKCILRINGIRPFKSDKYDITQHKNFKMLEDGGAPKFNIDKYNAELQAKKQKAEQEVEAKKQAKREQVRKEIEEKEAKKAEERKKALEYKEKSLKENNEYFSSAEDVKNKFSDIGTNALCEAFVMSMA